MNCYDSVFLGLRPVATGGGWLILGTRRDWVISNVYILSGL